MSILRNNRTREEQATQRTHTTQSHIELACCEHSSTQVKVELIESHTLTFMHSDSPSQSKRILGESTHQFLLHLALLLIVLIAIRLPRAVRHHVGFTTFDSYLYLVLAQLGDGTDGAIHPTLLLVVTGEHHLCTHLQLQGQVHRKTLLLELSCHCPLVGVLLCLNLSQLLLIDAVCRLVERSQGDYHAILLCRMTDTLV